MGFIWDWFRVCLGLVESLLRVGFGLIQGLFSWDRFEVYLGFVWGLFAVSLWSYGLFEKLIYVKLFVCFMMVGVKFIQGCLPASLPPCLHASLPPCLPASLLAPCLLACFHACVLASQVLPWLLGCLLAGLLAGWLPAAVPLTKVSGKNDGIFQEIPGEFRSLRGGAR